MTLSGRGRRNKGAAFERYLADLLRLLWSDAKRGLGQSRDAHTADITGVPIRVEAKKRSSWPNIGAAMAQVWRDAKLHADPRPVCVISAKDREEPVVSFEIRQFIKFVEEERERVRSTSSERRYTIAALDHLLLHPELDKQRASDVLRRLREVILAGKHVKDE